MQKTPGELHILVQLDC